MRRFLIRLVQVFALAIIGTGFLVDSSFADTKAIIEAQCRAAGGFPTEITGNANVSYVCIIFGDANSAGAWLYCNSKDNCYWNHGCPPELRDSCQKVYPDGRPGPPNGGAGGGPPSGRPGGRIPTRRDGTTIDTVTAGTCADRGTCGRRAPTLGAPVNGIAVAPSKTAPAGAPVNSVLNAAAPSPTAPAASTGAALNAATGLGGIDKSVAIPSQLSDHLSRMRR